MANHRACIVSQWLRHNTSLVTLDLSSNNIRPSTVLRLARALIARPQFRCVNLSATSCRDQGQLRWPSLFATMSPSSISTLRHVTLQTSAHVHLLILCFRTPPFTISIFNSTLASRTYPRSGEHRPDHRKCNSAGCDHIPRSQMKPCTQSCRSCFICLFCKSPIPYNLEQVHTAAEVQPFQGRSIFSTIFCPALFVVVSEVFKISIPFARTLALADALPSHRVSEFRCLMQIIDSHRFTSPRSTSHRLPANLRLPAEHFKPCTIRHPTQAQYAALAMSSVPNHRFCPHSTSSKSQQVPLLAERCSARWLLVASHHQHIAEK